MKREYLDNPETAFSGSGKTCKSEAKIADRERLIGQLYAENTFLKKSLIQLRSQTSGASKTGVTDIMYSIIKHEQEHAPRLGLRRACSALEVSRSGYCKWLKREQAQTPDTVEMKVRDAMQKIAVEFSRMATGAYPGTAEKRFPGQS